MSKNQHEILKQSVDFSEIGSTGLDHSAGEIFEEKLRALQRSRRYLIFQEMADNDATIGAFLFAIDMLIRQIEWRVQPASEQPEDIEAADFLESCMEDMSQPWIEVISEILGSMLPNGHAPIEQVFKRRLGASGPDAFLKPGEATPASRFDDGRIGWHKMALRSPETIVRWDLTDAGETKGFWQSAPPLYRMIYIPIEKCLLFRTSSKKNSPEGKSILRNAYRSWYLKKKIENLEAIGVERDLAGLPMAMVPPEIMSANASADEKAIYEKIKKIVTNVRRDEQEGIVFPLIRDELGNPLYDFKLLSTGGSRQFKTTEIINRYRQDIAMTVMADFILVGHEKVGSHSMHSSKTTLFAVALGAWVGMIKEVFNTRAIPLLFGLNQFSLESLPTLEHADIETVDLTELGTYITALTGAGISLTDEKSMGYLKGQANIPMSATEEDGDSEDGKTDAEGTVTPPVEEPAAPASTGGEIKDGPNATNIRDLTLNGAQVTALVELLTSVKSGILTSDQGSVALQSSFNFSKDVADRLVKVDSTKPLPAAPPKTPLEPAANPKPTDPGAVV